MIQWYRCGSAREAAALLQRSGEPGSACQETVARVFQEVGARGDAALRDLSEAFDSVRPREIRVSRAEMEAAAARLPEPVRRAVLEASRTIERFHRSRSGRTPAVETAPGVTCWKRTVPLERAGLYVPGGTAPLFSSVLMLAVPARIAGCRQISLCTPPGPDGGVNPAILYAAGISGIQDVYRIGGAQAIAAMCLGTETVPKADKLFGPGNRYVTAAKIAAFSRGTAIDMPAGPSEVMVIADETAVPSFVAADLLSQAEHDRESQAVLVTTAPAVLEQTRRELAKQISSLGRRDIIECALRNSMLILVPERADLLRVSDLYAPEHLIICTHDAPRLAEQVRHAGSVFIGNYSPEAAGDYCSGTNHTLPTGGYARSFSGLSVDSFCKDITFQQLSPRGLAGLARTIDTMANAEGLTAHARAVSIRMEYSTGGTGL